MKKRIVFLAILVSLSGVQVALASQSETSSAQKETLQDESSIRKNIRSKQTRKELKQLLSTTAKVGLNGALAYTFRDNAGAMIVLSSYLYQQVQSDIPFIASKLSPKGWGFSERHELQTKLYSMEEEFEVRRKFFSEHNQQVVTKLLEEAQTNVDQVNPHNSYIKGQIETALKKLTVIFSLPVKRIQVNDPEAVYSTMEAHLKTFDPSVQGEINKALVRILTGSNSNFDHLKGNNSTKAAYYFLGEAGTGKTSTAEAIAKALGLPFCKFNLGNTSPDDFMGKADQNTGNTVPGRLAKCFIAPDSGEPGVNPIIFIDEIHDVLNADTENARRLYSILKILTDPDQTEFEEALGIRIDLSKTTFIFGGNTPFKDTANALNSRLITIEFPPLTSDQKEVIAQRSLTKIAEKFQYSVQPSDREMLAEILKHDREPGARILNKVIEDYIIHQVALRQERIGQDSFDIQGSFKRNGSLSARKGEAREN